MFGIGGSVGMADVVRYWGEPTASGWGQGPEVPLSSFLASVLRALLRSGGVTTALGSAVALGLFILIVLVTLNGMLRPRSPFRGLLSKISLID